MKSDYSDMIGHPFEKFGRWPGPCDCLGFVIEAGRRIGIPVPDYGSEDPEDTESVSRKVDGARVDFVEVKVPCQGDLVEFSRAAMEDPSWHMGIMITDAICIHTTPKTGGMAVPVHRLNNRFAHKVARFWRCKKASG